MQSGAHPTTQDSARSAGVGEWSLGEYARDAAQLGYKKALLILGHEGSERAGMVYTADILREMYPDLEVQYFECGEVYTYTDSER